MATKLPALLILAATFGAAAPAGATDRPGFVMNQWGGVVSCDFTHNPLATRRMRAFCAGRHVAAADPARFDCRKAEVASEFDFCRRPYPTR